MITKLVYIPANEKYILTHITNRISCVVKALHAVAGTIAVQITLNKNDAGKLENLLHMYELV